MAERKGQRPRNTKAIIMTVTKTKGSQYVQAMAING